MVLETKLDDSFPVGQFLIDGFQQPFRFDRRWYFCYPIQSEVEDSQIDPKIKQNKF